MSAPRRIEYVEHDVAVNGEDFCIGFRIGFDWYRENYGADADGRRGEMRTFVEADAMTTVPERVQFQPVCTCDRPEWFESTGDNGWPDVAFDLLPKETRDALVAAMQREVERLTEEPPYDQWDAADDDGDAAYDYAKENPDDY
jgi:hypothetical protein